MRELIPLRELIREIREHMTLYLSDTARAHSRVFEDNAAALQLATTHRLTSNTRWFCTKVHHFWQYVRNQDLHIEGIATADQIADIFTKGLTRQTFEKLRKLLMGW